MGTGTETYGSYGFAPALHYYREGQKGEYEEGELHSLLGCEVESMHYVSALSEAEDGTIWIGTGTGLLAYDKAAHKMRRFIREDGLSENAITALTRGNAADLWIGTNGGGVVHYADGVFQIISLGKHPFENAVEAILLDSKEQLWFGTRAGLVAYHPGETPPSVTIRQVVVDRTHWEPEAVEYPETVAEVRIIYQGIRFKGNARQICYSHRLCSSHREGTWSAFEMSSEATYRNLSAGSYCFEVRAMDRDGLCSEPTRLSITVTPDPHKERFQALAGSLHSVRQPLLGDSASLQKVLKDISQVAATEMTVLILGETGTGKGLVAQIIHEQSTRRKGPFIPLNCGAIPIGLVESELFGHEKGAFTGAVARKIGHFELADGGTLFLDEIGDLPMDSQRVLLHILEEQAVTRVGGSVRIPIDTRVVAATHRHLKEAIQKGEFREDLFYRLHIFTIELPPLRQRKEDIPVLVYYFADQFARHFNRSIPEIPAHVMRHLQEYDWPGNVRELEHMIQRAVLVCGDQLRTEDLPVLVSKEERVLMKEEEEETAQLSLEELEKQRLKSALKTTNWIVYGERGAAKLLGMHPEKLRSRMRKYGLKNPKKSKG